MEGEITTPFSERIKKLEPLGTYLYIRIHISGYIHTYIHTKQIQPIYSTGTFSHLVFNFAKLENFLLRL